MEVDDLPLELSSTKWWFLRKQRLTVTPGAVNLDQGWVAGCAREIGNDDGSHVTAAFNPDVRVMDRQVGRIAAPASFIPRRLAQIDCDEASAGPKPQASFAKKLLKVFNSSLL